MSDKSDSSLSDKTKARVPPSPAAVPSPGADSQEVRRGLTTLLPDLRAFARFLARDPGFADDLVQDTVVRALAASSQFRPGTNLKAWLFTIERNAFYEYSRRRKREDRLLRERLTDPQTEAPHAIGRGEVTDLQRMLFALPPLLREALVLVGAQELSYDEAAVICGVPVGTMKARVSRARTQLTKIAEGGTPAARRRPDPLTGS